MHASIHSFLPYCWLLAIVVLLRWFKGIASDPNRGETADSAY